MDEKIKKAWIRYLRSGKYKQAKHKLKNTETGGYCCLGVLCKCLQNHRYPGVKWNDKYGVVNFNNIQDYRGLPSGLLDKLGMSRQGVLMNMNDSGKRFTTIANWIEKNL